ncbi:MAG: chorismate mutase [Rhodospirillaceae bacterium]
MAGKKAKRKIRARRPPPRKRKPAPGGAKGKTARSFKSLTEVRKAIDAIDCKLVPLLVERLSYVTQAAQFKPSMEGVIVLDRVEEVVENAKRLAAAAGGNSATIEVVYRALIDAFTADEQQRWRELHPRS